MIEWEDLRKPVRLYVVVGAERSWRTFWRKRERTRILFAGYMRNVQWSAGVNEPRSLSVQFEDAIERLQYTTYSQETEKGEGV